MDYGIAAMVKRVASGDPDNVESQAARRYWMVLFGDEGFRRGGDDPRNALLNYGYAILRAATVRALSASGLHPTFGLHHRSKLNPFALGDDVMEPYRPVVDRAVVRVVRSGGNLAMSPGLKKEILRILAERYEMESEERTLFDILTKAGQGLAAAVMSGDLSWKPPMWDFLD
ncbi:MAG: type II CRISPR-associated endonuclease Cas1 [Bryobacterales bacterium]|nr:type II CRISPR-associated endonuclease Cas1 [Bryobacterales bacterium]